MEQDKSEGLANVIKYVLGCTEYAEVTLTPEGQKRYLKARALLAGVGQLLKDGEWELTEKEVIDETSEG